uniref:C-type lectin domain-containing protein n=1 Tax=Pelusios castaneus TaxID=367368 RepID=A0A8C8RVC9_9SAUR
MRSSGAGASSAVPSLENLERGQHGSSVVPSCLDGWIGYRGKCYYFSEEEKNWGSSQHFCTSVNASLATIDTQQEKDFVMRYAGLTEHWIGLRRESDQSWKWVNGTQFNQFSIRGGGDCAYLNYEKRVSSSRCSTERWWICSKPEVHMIGTGLHEKGT